MGEEGSLCGGGKEAKGGKGRRTRERGGERETNLASPRGTVRRSTAELGVIRKMDLLLRLLPFRPLAINRVAASLFRSCSSHTLSSLLTLSTPNPVRADVELFDVGANLPPTIYFSVGGKTPQRQRGSEKERSGIYLSTLRFE